MRILGIDFLDIYIGLAISDRLMLTSQPLELYLSKNKKDDKKYFEELVKKHEISKIVIGLPLQMDGEMGDQAKKVKHFAERIEAQLGLPVVLWDERLTTKQAMHILAEQGASIAKKKLAKDKLSAAIILSGYLESLRE